MDPNYPYKEEVLEDAEGDARVVYPAPIEQPRQPHDLQGLLRFAMEARRDKPEGSVISSLDSDRQAFLAEVLDNLVIDSLVSLRTILPILTDPEIIGNEANKDTISEETKEAFNKLMEVVEDPHNANGFCSLNGFDMFPLCYSAKNPELWANANNALAGVCQNSEVAQILAVEKGLLLKLIELIQDPITFPRRDAVVYAMSSIVRDQSRLSHELITLGGVKVLMPLLGSDDVRLKIKAARLLLTLLQAHPYEMKERMVTLRILERMAPQLDTHKQPYTEHYLALLHAFVSSTFKNLKHHSAPVLEMKRVIEKLLTSSSILEDPDQNKEIIEYATELADMLQYKGPPIYDYGEEADR